MSPIMSLVCPFAFISEIIKSHIGEVDFGALVWCPNLQICNISRRKVCASLQMSLGNSIHM